MILFQSMKGAINNMLEEEVAIIESADLTNEDKILRIRMIDEKP